MTTVYAVWIVSHTDDYKRVYEGSSLIGVYTDKLTACKVACTKQIKFYENLDSDDEEEELAMPYIKWMVEHPFPEVEDTLETWIKYYNLLQQPETIYAILGEPEYTREYPSHMRVFIESTELSTF